MPLWTRNDASGLDRVLVTGAAGLLGRAVVSDLIDHGYAVHAFPTPSAALAFVDAHPGPLDLLVTDVMMPGMTGRDLVREVHQRRPDVPALYMSGYPADVIARQGLLDAGVEFLQKPFSVGTLVGRASELLRERVRPS